MRNIRLLSVLTSMSVGFLLTQASSTAHAEPTLTAKTFAAAAAKVQGEVRLTGVKTVEGGLAELKLQRFAVFSEDAKIVVELGDNRREQFGAPATAFFRGEIAGESGSRAFVAVQEDGTVSGLIERNGKMQQLTDTGVDEQPLLLQAAAEDSNNVHGSGFTCGSDQLQTPPSLPNAGTAKSVVAPSAESPSAATYRARIAIETDFEFYGRFNSQSTATTYVGNLMGYASTIYTAQIQTQLEVSYLRLWATSADPWVQTSSSCGMFEFGKYWNDNMGSTSRSIAHMLSGKTTGGGVAWVGVLCSAGFDTSTAGSSCPGMAANGNFGGGYGFTGNINGGFNAANPTPVWDIVATSHEIGHNFDSPHTHCYNNVGGSASPVDQCYNGEASNGCYSGAQALPGAPGSGSGTIMSYCHQLGGGMSNIGLTFGSGHPYGVQPARVPTRMAAHVAARATQYPSCLALGSAPLPNNIFSARFE